jgi:2-polyprenyl-6-methoxyphenol hydroxylase-like FAD-dependent oxidoreductase
VADPALRASAERAVALTLARAGDPTRLIEISRRPGDAYGRIVALAQAAEDVMKSEDELRQSGGSIFLARE